MSRGRHHDPVQYDRVEVSINGLACPFAKSDPEMYMRHDACRATEGFKELRVLRYLRWTSSHLSTRQPG
jgi:hypothetical protein